MKIEAILLLFILAISLVHAADNVNPTDELKKNLGHVNANNIASNIDTTLNKPITIPSSIQEIARWMFGIESTITFENLIILLAVWLGFVIIIYSIVSIIPLFEDKNFISVIIAVILTTLASTAGTIQQSSLFLISLFKFLDFTRFSFLKVLVIVLTLVIITSVVAFISKKIKDATELEEAENEGINQGIETAINKKMRKN